MKPLIVLFGLAFGQVSIAHPESDRITFPQDEHEFVYLKHSENFEWACEGEVTGLGLSVKYWIDSDFEIDDEVRFRVAQAFTPEIARAFKKSRGVWVVGKEFTVTRGLRGRGLNIHWDIFTGDRVWGQDGIKENQRFELRQSTKNKRRLDIKVIFTEGDTSTDSTFMTGECTPNKPK